MYTLRKNILAISIKTTYKALKICNFEHNVETDRHFMSNAFYELKCTSLIYCTYLHLIF